MVSTDAGTATASWTALGCLVHLTVTDPAALASARAMLTSDLADLDAACSRFRPDSELARLDQAAGRPTAISPLLAEAIAVALRAAELTGGDVAPRSGGATPPPGSTVHSPLFP